jgi:guanosine-3',5'-bis(diphosphate) 3'-pyrophosphohydrolase
MNTELDLGRILEAAIFATQKHQGQVRKGEEGLPYITHPISVAKVIWEIGGVKDNDILVAAILHDTIEDTQTTKNEIKERFGEEILSIVLEVTDDKKLEKIERKRRQVLHAATLSYPAKIIKLGDKLINCGDILLSPPNGWDLERRRDYIQWGADVVSRIRGTNQALEQAFDEMLAQAEGELAYKIKSFNTISERPWGPIL